MLIARRREVDSRFALFSRHFCQSQRNVVSWCRRARKTHVLLFVKLAHISHTRSTASAQCSGVLHRPRCATRKRVPPASSPYPTVRLRGPLSRVAQRTQIGPFAASRRPGVRKAGDYSYGNKTVLSALSGPPNAHCLRHGRSCHYEGFRASVDDQANVASDCRSKHAPETVGAQEHRHGELNGYAVPAWPLLLPVWEEIGEHESRRHALAVR